MPNPTQYKKISDRYLNASDLLVDDVHEAAGFSLYHAFESMGAAWIRKNARVVPRRHERKINMFVSLTRNMGHRTSIGLVAILLNSLRNNMLYPIPEIPSGFSIPHIKFSVSEIKNLSRRVKGVLSIIRPLI